MKLFSKIKDVRGTRFQLYGLTVYELRKTPGKNITYLLGIKVRSKRPKGLIDAKALADAERNIRHMAETVQHLQPEEKHILCFDCLYDPLAEAIDAWALFEYLQTQGIPSRYAILKNNPLYTQLEQQNKLKDILPVDNEFDLLLRYPEEIARSKRIFFSFPFTCSRILRDLPNCPFIFIEHGVNLMKPWCVRLYTEGGDSECNYILTPSRPTKDLYDSMHLMQGKMLCCGLPRWDKLSPHQSDKPHRNIFVFFTWRTSFIHDKRLLGIYTKRISDFVSQLQELIKDKSDISLHIGLHHALLLHNPQYDFNSFGNARIVPTNEISSMIRDTDLFITDYSSICFDLMYRNVPTIFYRFDSDLIYSNSMDNEIRDTIMDKDRLLYNCCYNKQMTLKLVNKYIENNFVLDEEIKQKNNEIFWERGNNCKRLMAYSEMLA